MVEIKQIQNGFKKTEIGIIPIDWDVVPFEAIADKNKKWSITGGPFGSNLKVSDYTNEGVQIVQLQNIGDGIFYDDYKIYTSEEKANQLISCNILPNEIIVSKMGDPVARACFIPNKAKRYLMASDGIRLVVNEKEFSKKFIHDYINSKFFRLRAFEVSSGSTRLRIGLPVLKSLLVVKPPLKEQKAIASLLNDTDELISKTEKLIAKKRAIKQGAMQELLTGRKRLTGFSSRWEETNLGIFSSSKKYSIVDGPFGSQMKVSDFLKNGVPVIEMEHLENNYINKETLFRFISVAKFNEIIRSAVYPNDIIISKTGSLGKLGIIPKNIKKAIITSRLAKISLDPKKSNIDFVFQCLLWLQAKNYWNKISQGGTMQILSINNIANAPIPNICIKEQMQIAEILTNMDSEIETLEKKLKKLQNLKQGMMQNLLTGKIRIPIKEY